MRKWQILGNLCIKKTFDFNSKDFLFRNSRFSEFAASEKLFLNFLLENNLTMII